MNNPFYPRPMPWRKLLSCELVFVIFYRKHLWSGNILETWHDARDNSTHRYLQSYDIHWHRGNSYSCEEVGRCPYDVHEQQVPPFHPAGPYGLPVTYWVKDGFQVASYQGSQQITALPSWVCELFFITGCS